MQKHVDQKHKDTDQEAIVKKFICDECGRRFVSGRPLVMELIIYFVSSGLSLAGHKKVHKKKASTNSRPIIRPEVRSSNTNGHSKSQEFRGAGRQAGVLFSVTPSGFQPQLDDSIEDMSIGDTPTENMPIEDMPDLF